MKNTKEKGQSLIEYVALTALVAIVTIGTVKVFGGKVKSRLHQITNTFDRNIQQGLKAKVEIDEDGDTNTGVLKIPGLKFPKVSLPRLPH